MADRGDRAAARTTNGKPRKDTDRTAGGREGAGPGPDGVCPVAFCPVGLALSGVKRVSPETVDHLLSAAREFLMAARAVIDARARDFEDHKGPTRLERIEIA